VKKGDYTRFCIAPGDVWQAGAHILACGDLERGDGEELLERFGPRHPDGWLGSVVTYSDPPWNAGIARNFRAQAGVGRPVVFELFLRRFIKLVNYASPHHAVFLEMGNQCLAQLLRITQERGGVVLGQWKITYYSNRPCVLCWITFSPDALGCLGDLRSPEGMDDGETPALMIEQFSQRSDFIFDPCVGLGTTALAAHSLGRRMLGLELNPMRLSCALSRLEQQGLPVGKVGSLFPTGTRLQVDDPAR